MATRALCATLAAALVSQSAAIEAPSCATYGAGYNDPFRHKVPNGGLLASSLDCQRVCQRTAFCERFTFYNNSGGCWLQGHNWTEVVSPYIISGPVLCPGEVRPGSIGPFEPLSAEADLIWKDVVAGKVEVKQKQAIASTTVNTGLPDSELAGRVVVVHDATGARVACSPLVDMQGHLEASAFTPYPGYLGTLMVTGVAKFNAPSVKTEQVIAYKLKGTDEKCGSEAIEGVANACGIHIHEGTSCISAGGHFYNKTTDTVDPWQAVTYETLGTWSPKSLAKLGTPALVAEQTVNGKNFIYSFPGPPAANVTVLKSPDGKMEVTDVTGLPEPDIKARGVGLDENAAAQVDEGHSNFPWWAWLLIALGIVFLIGLIVYFCFMDGKKSKKKEKGWPKKDSAKQRDVRAAVDVENVRAEKTPLMTSPAAGSQVAMASRAAQSPTNFSAGQGVIPSVASPVAMPYLSGGQPMVMPGAQPMVYSGAQPMVMSGAQPAVMAQPMVTYPGVQSGVMSPQVYR